MPADDVILSIDQGSSSSRCIAYDADLRPVASASSPLGTSRPGPGMVEHDPAELLAGVRSAVERARGDAGGRVAAVAIANQTESFLVWDAETGAALTPIVSWQDQRAAELCERLAGTAGAERVTPVTGLPLDPTFAAPKLAWLLERDERLHERCVRGEARFGDIGCWLIWQLAGAAAHVTEPSNAHRSLLVDLDTLGWDAGLLELFGVPAAILPRITRSNGTLAVTSAAAGFEAPVSALLGDQPAALRGQGCTSPGLAALTLGTGAFLWMHAGAERPEPPPGVLATPGWDAVGGRAYALEAFCPNAGNALALLRGMGFHTPGGRLDWSRPQPIVVAAPNGLGTPHWDSADRITMLAGSSATTQGDLAAAGRVGIAHQIVDALEAVSAAAPPLGVRVGGGLAADHDLVQAIADLSGLTLSLSSELEATARGVAALAAEALGGREPASPEPVATLEPALDARSRERERARWRAALQVHLAGGV